MARAILKREEDQSGEIEKRQNAIGKRVPKLEVSWQGR
jgi:hypothetical protein